MIDDSSGQPPGDHTTLSEVLALYADAGFTESFEALDDSLRCVHCSMRGSESKRGSQRGKQ